MLRVLGMTAGLAVSILLLLRIFPEVRLREVVATVSRPILAAGAMAAALTWGLGGIALPVLAGLVLKVLVGALAYAVALAVLWLLVGRPPGAERYLVEKIGAILGRTGLAK